MARYSNALTAVFEAYGEDADAALAAYANTDPEGWASYVDAAVTKQYLADCRNWSRQLVGSVVKERLSDQTGQARLFDPGASGARVELRKRLRLDGVEHEMATLTDTGVIRKVAERDQGSAKTTLVRSALLRQLADFMDAETVRLGRPVTAGEVLGWAA